MGVQRTLWNPTQSQPRGNNGTKNISVANSSSSKNVFMSEKSLDVLEKQEKVQPENFKEL